MFEMDTKNNGKSAITRTFMGNVVSLNTFALNIFRYFGTCHERPGGGGRMETGKLRRRQKREDDQRECIPMPPENYFNLFLVFVLRQLSSYFNFILANSSREPV